MLGLLGPLLFLRLAQTAGPLQRWCCSEQYSQVVFPKLRGGNGTGGKGGSQPSTSVAIISQRVGEHVVRAGSLRDPLLDFILT